MTNPNDFRNVQIELDRVMGLFEKNVRGDIAKAVGQFTKSVRREQSSVQRGMLKLHEHIGTNAHQEITKAYKASGIGRRPSYRYADEGKLRRFSNGAMERALRHGSMMTFNSRTLNFINKDTLDREAKQWYRLNFGAGPRGRGGNAPRIKNWSLGRTRIPFTVSLAGYGPSANFRVPHSLNYSGTWSTVYSPTNLSWRAVQGLRRRPNRGGALYLVPMRRVGRGYRKRNGGLTKGNLAPEPTMTRGPWSRGIRGSHFLEEGVNYINREYPKQLNNLLNTWMRVSVDSIGRRKPFTWNPI